MFVLMRAHFVKQRVSDRSVRDAHRRKLAIEFLSDTSLTAAEIAC